MDIEHRSLPPDPPREDRAAHTLAAAMGADAVRMSGSFHPFQVALVKGPRRVIVGWVEAKSRNVPFSRLLDDYLLPVKKYEAVKMRAAITKTPAYLAIEFADGVYACEIAGPNAVKIKCYALGAGRGPTNENEPMAMIDIADFKLIKLNA